MALEEKVFTIPLRKDWLKKSRVARTNRSVDAIRIFLSRHMKSDEIKLSPLLNESLWKRGAKKPPAFVKVKVAKDEKGKVTAMMPEERMEITEKKGLKHKLLRRKGETEAKIVHDEKKPIEAKPADVAKPVIEKQKAEPKPEEKK